LLSDRLIFTGLGFLGMTAAYYFDFTVLGRFPKAIFGSAVGVFAILFIFNLFAASADRFRFETLTLVFPPVFSLFVYANRNKGYRGIFYCMAVFAALCFISAHFAVSGALHFAAAGTLLLGAAVIKKWFNIRRRVYGLLLIFAPFILLAAGLLWDSGDTFRGVDRWISAFAPYTDPTGRGYMTVFIRALVGGGAWFGPGTVTDNAMLPESFTAYWRQSAAAEIPANPSFYSDLSLTSVIYFAGWFAFAAVAGILAFFAVKGIRRCFQQKSGLGFLVSAAVIFSFAVQTAIYVVYNLGFTLIPPLSLPFVSFGNAAAVINLTLAGLMLSVFRTGHETRDFVV
jgi:cell division protein FtsW (lipid II flippase)